MAGILRLPLANHVNHLDPIRDHTGSGHRLESEHRSDLPFDDRVILLNAIVEISALPNANGFQTASRSVLKPICRLRLLSLE